MELVKIKNYLEHLDFLISHECTGTADEFAKKLKVSERTLQNHLKQLRETGIDIVYCYEKRSYCYAEEGNLVFGFTSNDLNNIRGGVSLFKDTFDQLVLIH